MRVAGLHVWHALQIAGSMMRPGVTTAEIDQRVERFFLDRGAIPLFKGVPGKVPYPAVTCISVNEEVVHGIPGKRVLTEGDIVSVDTGCKIDGWCGDSALTFSVGKISPLCQKLLDVTKGTLDLAIELLPKSAFWNDVAAEMESYVRESGFCVIEALVGHGIGREMHEDPPVPNYVCKQTLRQGDFRIQPGLVIAIEPMVNVGTKEVVLLKDHWTYRSADRKPSAHFEHTVAMVGAEGGMKTCVLTGPPCDESEKIDISAYIG